MADRNTTADHGATSFNITPPDFDVTTASQEALAAFGIPARPDPDAEPQAFANWGLRFPKGFRLIKPELKVNPGRRHTPLSLISKADGTSDNWSGAVINPAAGRTFQRVDAGWTVVQAWAPQAGSYHMSSWVGIDGSGSDDVVQGGIAHEVTEPGDAATYYFWYEWYPNLEVQITNLTVSPGDLAGCTVTATSTTTATILIGSGNNNVSINVQAPKGTTLQGNCAEWVVERPMINNAYSILPNYGSIKFAGVAAVDDKQAIYRLNDASLTLLTMVESSRNISVPHELNIELLVDYNALNLAFLANDTSNRILISTSDDGISWTGGSLVAEGESSKASPSLAAFLDRLYLAFIANNPGNALLVCSSNDGRNWTGNSPVPGQSSQTAPSLAVFNERLSIAFLANDSSNRILICRSNLADASGWTGNSLVAGGNHRRPPRP